MSGDAAEAEVRAAFDDYLRRTNLHDFWLVLPCIAPDAIYCFGTRLYVGRIAIRRAFEAAWSRIVDERYSASDVKVMGLEGGLAVLSYSYRWVGLVDGQLSEGGGLGTNLFRREATNWRITYEHLSLGEVRPINEA